MNIQMSFFYGEYLTNKKKMGALCFSLVLSCQWFSAFSACVCEWYKKKLPLYLAS